ncbi:MAG: hypothetical protein ACRCUS_09440, partial [Anaerovoracaceae bacterium]
FSGTQNKYFKGIPYCRYRGSQQQHSLTLRTFLYLVILKKFQFSHLFYPVLTCISMETGRSCRARWRIAAAAHNLCILIGQIACQSSSLRTVNWKCRFISQLTDDTTLFLKDSSQVSVALNILLAFSKASCLNLNINKCELGYCPLKIVVFPQSVV